MKSRISLPKDIIIKDDINNLTNVDSISISNTS